MKANNIKARTVLTSDHFDGQIRDIFYPANIRCPEHQGRAWEKFNMIVRVFGMPGLLPQPMMVF